jgi:hypothetical protein
MRYRPAIFCIVLMVGCEDRKYSSPDIASAPSAQSQTSASVANSASPVDGPTTSSELNGQIRGKEFKPDRIVLEGDTLRFCKGKEHSSEQEIRFRLPVPEGERLGGREWKIGGQYGDPDLTLNSRVAGVPDSAQIHGQEYEMKLRFTNQTATSVEGTIDIQFKNPEKTWLRGPFTAEYRKSTTAPLDESDAPFVHGKVIQKGNDKAHWDISVGFVGIGVDGKPYSNAAGFPVIAGQGASVTSAMRAPQVTSFANHLTAGLIYRHWKVPPGDYLVFVRKDDAMFDWKRLSLQENSQIKLDLTIDLLNAGEVKFVLPKSSEPHVLAMVPAGIDMPDLGPDAHLFFTVARPKPGETTTTVQVPPGKYRAMFGKVEATVDVVAGKSIDVTLPK